MGDDETGDRTKVLALLYLELAKAYNDGERKDVIKLKAKVEKDENHKINEDKYPLYSQKQGKLVSFSDKVVELNNMYDDLIFNLSDNSNESLRELKTFTTEEIIKFEKRIAEKVKRNSKTK